MNDKEHNLTHAPSEQPKNGQHQRQEFAQFVVFNLDTEEYGVPITDLREIITLPEVTPVPNTPDFICGILNLRGKIVVVIDLEKRFSLVREENRDSRHVIIVEVNENVFGVIVDKVEEVLRVSVDAIQKAPALTSTKIHAEYMKGVIVIDPENPSKTLEDFPEDKKHVEQKSGSSDQDGARLLLLVDLPKILEDKELLKVEKKVSSTDK